jgi:DNA-binding response OmpR family regulator
LHPLSGDFPARGSEGAARIVVADDEPHIVQLIQSILLRQGYRVETARNGVEALARIRSDRPDLVISDVMMPEMDGLSLLDHLRQDPDTRDLPVILLTAKTSDADMLLGHMTGADMYLTKPFRPEELVAFVRRLLPLPMEPGATS